MATGAKAEGIPAQVQKEAALKRRVNLICLEDNTQCTAAVRTGYSAALRFSLRTERANWSVAHELSVLDLINELRHEEAAQHRGDVFTKCLQAPAFEAAIARLGLVRMTDCE